MTLTAAALRASLALGLAWAVATHGAAAAPEPPRVPVAVVSPRTVTEPVRFDADDPALWIDLEDRARSLVLGTDKHSDGALYVFDLQGRIVPEKTVRGLARPNNVDVAYGFLLGGEHVDIAVVTEREPQRLRVFALPSMRPLDRGDLIVFDGDPRRAPMGIALYKRPRDGAVFAIVGGKSGPANGHLAQYLLADDGRGGVAMSFVRAFGAHRGRKEIEAIAVDAELGYVYYSDEGAGVRKYAVDPEARNRDTELALFATSGFAADHEGISIYRTGPRTGYLIVSDQGANRFWIHRREGEPDKPHEHTPVKIVQAATRASDGNDVTSLALPGFADGVLVAMSDDRTFHFYAWADVAGPDLLTRSAALAAAAQHPPAEQLTRGPYLQLGTPTTMVVRWRTAAPATSFVRFGLSPHRLDREARSPGTLAEHVVYLEGLQPATRYYYEVGTAHATLAGGAECTFVTSPPPGNARPVRAWVVGDPGTATDHQRRVRDAYARFTGTRGTDLWLMLGDNAYEHGTDEQYQRAVFAAYPRELRQSVLWPTFGNHDGGSAHSITQSGVYYDTFTLPTQGQAGGVPSGTEAYYSFDYAHVHFICLDSFDSDRRPGGPMARWLQADLQANRGTWTVAYFHHPPYSKGSHDSDQPRTQQPDGGRLADMRETFLPLLEAGGVDLVLAGHCHSYERSHLLSGHHGTSDSLTPAMILQRGEREASGRLVFRKPPGRAPHAGHISIVAGSSGKVDAAPKLDHPAMAVSLAALGSLVLDFDATRLDVTFLDDRGAIRDAFSIVKP